MAKQAKTTTKKTSARKNKIVPKSTGPKSSKPTSPKKKKAPPAASLGGIPPIRVRMFRHGLGDSFLVTFDAGGNERQMLIDCGTLGNKTTDVRVEDVADHVKKLIGDGKLDVVVVTHEHKDHLSGFNGPMKVLKDEVEHVWLAWTEDPRDPDAQKMTKYRDDLGQALAIMALAAPDSEVSSAVTDLLGFAGDVGEEPLGFAKTVHAAMEFVRTELKAKVHYFQPGDLLEEEWLPGFRFYFLGPPRDPNRIKEMGDHGDDQLYGAASGLRSAAMVHMAVQHQFRELTPDELEIHENQLPFDTRFNHDDEILKHELYPRYGDEKQRWRSVDYDWLTLGSQLALQLDSLTNNTSLAFAIERIADGKVLLFPADAQLGSWKSWHDDKIQWTVSDSGGTQKVVRTKDLLQRTVFYKVGHHGSHNSTARGLGLEMMDQVQELVAFIPVDRNVALSRNPKGSWKMPARPLYRRLLEKCQGRVARSDIGLAADPGPVPDGDTESGLRNVASTSQWQAYAAAQTTAPRVVVKDLFVEYLLE